MKIHPTAIVSEQARISPQAEIGPYSVISGEVQIGAGTIIESHVRIGSRFGKVVIGEHNFIQSGATLGGPPQDWSYENSQTSLVIGDHNRIGELASLNLGSDKGGGVTRVGDNAFIMAYAHVGHDCQIADAAVLTNLSQLAGHVIVERSVIVSGAVGVTQFARLGEFSFVAAGAFVNKDILPYTIAEGHWAAPKATNKVGLKRAGCSAEDIRDIDRAIRIVLRRTLRIEEALEKIHTECHANAWIERLVEFINSSERGIARA
ncbi:MAG: acyl-ACP--UDP-N-acetylglucosamine O-acyltransferase [Gammaproteobacteria bacterium]